MTDTDEWGRDPGVKRIRVIFGCMEEAQKSLLSNLAIDPYDQRLRGWRQRALSHFEQSWKIAASKGLKIDGQSASVIYLHCLAGQMSLDGIQVEPSMLGGGKEIDALVKESAT